ncbi:unnamed protein product [Urochloa humidicola]
MPAPPKVQSNNRIKKVPAASPFSHIPSFWKLEHQRRSNLPIAHLLHDAVHGWTRQPHRHYDVVVVVGDPEEAPRLPLPPRALVVTTKGRHALPAGGAPTPAGSPGWERVGVETGLRWRRDGGDGRGELASVFTGFR